MLIIKCAKCKTKIMKYEKIGKGKLIRCWKNKIKRLYEAKVVDKKLVCGNCGNIIGEIEGDYIKMNSNAFTYTGTRIPR
jgi:DNA-directed RNA polymerase subunit RPC12/RpoP